MELSEEARARLADVVELQPTKNAELADRWDLDGGSDVHQYLESELRDYYYRDENSLIRATPEAVELIDGDAPDGPIVVHATPLEATILDVIPAPDERSASVVAVLHALRDDHDINPPVEDVRSAVRALSRKGVVETVERTVPTYRLSVSRDRVEADVPGE